MENKLKEIILRKEFVELSADEKAMLSEWCQDEIVYDELKRMLILAGELSKEESNLFPDHSIKNRLNQEFNRHYRKRQKNESWLSAKDWFLFTRKPLWYSPALQFAFLAILAMIVLPFFMQQNSSDSSNRLAKNERKNTEIKQKEVEMKKAEEPSFKSDELLVPSKSGPASEKIVTANNELDFLEESPAYAESLPEMKQSSIATSRIADHPDGIYKDAAVSFIQSVNDQEGVLDLLYPTF
jgi:hypothetical protein